eukprot:TRINITY_DN1283_c0_g1_i1.p1 TRINITY_DN1283_c0_g1~~TRINITY_DN1283_c0_g1_i1.p1  ORF type:complete len:492 (+),score=179.30 TRINITY_DN1283_c0_g1_i1:41-1477(+)
MSFDTLHVTIVEARHLATMDRSGTSDPYVVLKNSFNTQKFKTKVCKKNLAPKWDAEFKLFTSKAEGTLELKMYDKDFISRDELMGELKIPLATFADGEEADKWYKLDNEPQKKKVDKTPGEIRIKIKFTGSAVRKGTTTSGTPASTPSKTAEKVDKKDEKPAAKAEEKEQKVTSIEQKYDLGKVIGRGAFSVVKIGIRKSNGKKYAVKIISKKLIDKKELTLLEREIDIMQKLQHPNIIQLVEVVDTPETLYLVLEFASGGELFDAIINKGSYSELEAAKIVRQILEAISFVHGHGIAHRDLKPENLLLSNEPGEGDFIKIADFGLSKDFGAEQMATSCGTPDYVAPEVLGGEAYDSSVDVWSIGVITYVLLCGFPPFYGDTQRELFENIMKGNYDFPDPEWSGVSEDAKEFIRKMLVVDPENRYNAEQCLKDKWIQDFTAEKSKRPDFKRVETFNAAKFKQYAQKYKEQNPNLYDKE